MLVPRIYTFHLLAQSSGKQAHHVPYRCSHVPAFDAELDGSTLGQVLIAVKYAAIKQYLGNGISAATTADLPTQLNLTELLRVHRGTAVMCCTQSERGSSDFINLATAIYSKVT
ncbi:uncharacterized protein RCO7_14901 [Rhynchosporium graminicola]|uniref:Uncharacterized protein n=1 Tax=Rhynchosporium graminicola TaxID=2792576 RepID=A0A1E1L9E6_9HELO|nr:uncharacterized protein RCO7_14901 [Rhynchosporium commune]